MTPQIGCDRRNPAGSLSLSSARRHSSSTTFVASSFFLDQTSNSNGGDHAGFRMPSSLFCEKLGDVCQEEPWSEGRRLSIIAVRFCFRMYSNQTVPKGDGMIQKRCVSLFSLLVAASLIGCGDSPKSGNQSSTTDQPQADESVSQTMLEDALPDDEPEIPEQESASTESAGSRFKPLTMDSVSTPGSGGENGGQSGTLSTEERIQQIMAELRPLQVWLGQWRGTTRREYEGFKAVDNHEWVWDLQTDPTSPALVLDSDKSPYLRSARLTWIPEDSRFLLTAVDAEGTSRDYDGIYSDPVHEVVGPDEKLHRVFKLEFTEQTDLEKSGSESWQLAFAQQENNRYLLEVSKQRGSAGFRRYDTVSTQREGTSFAISDSDYGDKTCIISQGLGTISVSYKGKSYWVCCSGCKAAFEENPEKWIARATAAKSE